MKIWLIFATTWTAIMVSGWLVGRTIMRFLDRRAYGTSKERAKHLQRIDDLAERLEHEQAVSRSYSSLYFAVMTMLAELMDTERTAVIVNTAEFKAKLRAALDECSDS